MEMINKKKSEIGMGSIFAFMVLTLSFILIIGLYDLSVVEIYEPASSQIKNMTLEINNNTETNEYYQGQIQIDNDVEELSLPFNLLFIFFSFASILFSLYDAVTRRKQPIFNLFIETIGGLVIGIYILHVVLIKAIEWIRIDIFNAIFGDLVLKYIPFYYYVLNYWAIFILIWISCFIVANRYFGREN